MPGHREIPGNELEDLAASLGASGEVCHPRASAQALGAPGSFCSSARVVVR